jgi:(p)ppGpp synthase/HD superfamily hydrolase
VVGRNRGVFLQNKKGRKMKKGEMLSKMLLLVTQRFDGKFDKSGNPYVLHLLKVMHYTKSDDEELQCIALGHDLVEDTPTTYAELYELGFTERVITGIRNMTKVPGETEQDYLDRLMSAKDSIIVKLADLRHNSDIRRLKGLAEKDFARMQKYHRMYLTLTERLQDEYEIAG